MSKSERQALHDLVDALPEEQIPQALARLKRMALSAEERAARTQPEIELVQQRSSRS